MARYSAALRTLRTVYELDPENSAAKSLQKRITYYMSTLINGKTSSGNGHGETPGEVHKRRRHELILLVDQDERVLTSLTASLRKYGFKTVGANSYQEAIEAIGTYKPDLIVSEVNFENGSVGYDLYLWIRMNDETREMPFLFLATRIDRDMLIAGKRLGVADFILKPLDEDLVTASIINCLSRTKAELPAHVP
jgi:PleD family two-component response regulator